MSTQSTLKQGRVLGEVGGLPVALHPLVMREECDQQTPPLAAQVAKLERRATVLDNLCGEMLACLHVNLQRGTLTTQDDDTLKMLLESWSRQRQSA